jgi:hypothetical protein
MCFIYFITFRILYIKPTPEYWKLYFNDSRFQVSPMSSMYCIYQSLLPLQEGILPPPQKKIQNPPLPNLKITKFWGGAFPLKMEYEYHY